jgi:hypothetical protein
MLNAVIREVELFQAAKFAQSGRQKLKCVTRCMQLLEIDQLLNVLRKTLYFIAFNIEYFQCCAVAYSFWERGQLVVLETECSQTAEVMTKCCGY